MTKLEMELKKKKENIELILDMFNKGECRCIDVIKDDREVASILKTPNVYIEIISGNDLRVKIDNYTIALFIGIDKIIVFR